MKREIMQNRASRKTVNNASTPHNSIWLRCARYCTLIGFFCLLALLLNWFSWLAPPQTVPRALPMIILVLPLMFAVRGLLYEKPYTHAWVSLLSMLYFAIGVDVAFNRDDQRLLGLALIVCSLLLFAGTVTFNYQTKKASRT